MIYTKLTNKAIKLAYQAHDGQVDKAGMPYILHPIHLAEQMDDEDVYKRQIFTFFFFQFFN